MVKVAGFMGSRLPGWLVGVWGFGGLGFRVYGLGGLEG